MKYYNRKIDALMMPSTFRWTARGEQRERSIMKYAPLVMKVVNKFNRTESRVGIFDKHDIIQSGFVGLVEGYDRIIKSEGKLNVNYLELNIKGTIDRYLNYQATGVAIPEYQLQKAKAEIVADRIFGAWMYSFRLEDINPKSGLEFTANFRQHDPINNDDSYANEELNELLSDILWQLSSRERDVIMMSFGMGYPKQSMKQMEEKFGITRQQLSRIKKKALKKLNTLKNYAYIQRFIEM